jgi:hypothetical protein
MKTKVKNLAKLVLTTFTALSISIITSCSKDDDSSGNQSIPVSDIFAVGTDNSSPSQEFYYKNNVKTFLSVAANESAQPSAMFVDGNDVYITGSVYVYPTTGNSYYQACYWKNNVKINLPHYIDPSGDNYAHSNEITVVNGDVYIVGVLAENFSANRQIVYWKNGVLGYITGFSATVSNTPSSICVYNNDIYVGGGSYDGTIYNAKIWKNGIVTNLSTNSSICQTVFADQTGVHALFGEYAGGGVTTAMKYWKDGVTTTISTQQPQIGKMTIKGTDVYITGAQSETGGFIYKACYWKNGVKTELSNGNSLIADELKIGANGDVFISSRLPSGGYSTLTYWKNNIKATLGNSIDNFADFDINNK